MRIVRFEPTSAFGSIGRQQTPGRRLLHAARLLRDSQRYIRTFGESAYRTMLGDCLWHVYRMIGKPYRVAFVLASPQPMDLDVSVEHVANHRAAAEGPKRVLERLAADGTVISRLDGTTHHVFPVGISLAEGEALRSWVVRERASRSIEIGLGYGVSTLHVCEGLISAGAPTPTHVAIDPYQHSRFGDCGLQLLEDGDVRELVEHVDGRSEIVLPELLKSEVTFDFAFVDGNHRFDAVFVDLFYLGRLVRPASVIFLDDYQLGGVRKAVAFYVSNLNWTMVEVSDPHSEHQWAVVRTSATPDDRPFTYFVDF